MKFVFKNAANLLKHKTYNTSERRKPGQKQTKRLGLFYCYKHPPHLWTCSQHIT